MPPGKTYIPVASITVALLAGIPARTSLISSPSMRMSAAVVEVAVTTVPLRMRVSGMCAHLPGFVRAAGVDLLHGDGVLAGTDQPAEVASHAFVFVDAWNAHGRRDGV